MIQDLDELRRRARATGDPADLQRLSLESMRAGLDIRGRALPSHALQHLQGYGFVQKGFSRGLRYSRSGRYFASDSSECICIWETEHGDCVWQSSKPSHGPLQFDSEDRLYFWRTGPNLEIILLRLSLRTQKVSELKRFRGARVFKLSGDGRFLGVASDRDFYIYAVGEGLERLAHWSVKDMESFEFFGPLPTVVWKDGWGWRRRAVGQWLARRESWLVDPEHWVMAESGEIYFFDEESLCRSVIGQRTGVIRSDPGFKNTGKLWLSACGRFLYVETRSPSGFYTGNEMIAALFSSSSLLCVELSTGQVKWQRPEAPVTMASHPSQSLNTAGYVLGSGLRSFQHEDGSDWCAGRWVRDKLRRLIFSRDSLSLALVGSSTVFSVLDWAQQRLIESGDGDLEDYDGHEGEVVVRRQREYLRGLGGVYEDWGRVAEFDPDVDLSCQFHHLTARQFPDQLYGMTIEEPGDWDWFQSVVDVDFARFPGTPMPKGRVLRLVLREFLVSVYDSEAGAYLWAEDFGVLRSASFSHSGRVLWLRYLLDDERYCARVEAETGRVLARVPDIWAEEQRDACNPPDFMTAFSVPGENGYGLILLDSEFRELARFQGHEHKITAIAFANDAGLLASGDADGAVFIWNTKPFLKGLVEP